MHNLQIEDEAKKELAEKTVALVEDKKKEQVRVEKEAEEERQEAAEAQALAKKEAVLKEYEDEKKAADLKVTKEFAE